MKNFKNIFVNKVEIQVYFDGQNYFVPIKPICTALDVNYSSQIKKIKRDEILNTRTFIAKTEGANGKTYKMRVLPLYCIYGWLFTINPRNVPVEKKKEVQAARMECYNKFYDAFMLKGLK